MAKKDKNNIMGCPFCLSVNVRTWGENRLRCNVCKKTFQIERQKRLITPVVEEIIFRLIKEDVSYSIIARATQVSKSAISSRAKQIGK